VTERTVRVAYLADAFSGGGGIGRYTRELLAGLGARPDLQLVVVVPPGDVEGVRRLTLPNVTAVVPIGGRGQVGRAVWERHRLGATLARFDIDVIHGTKHLLPRTAMPTVLTAYDVMPITSREQFHLVKRLLLPSQYLRSLREATIILSISETTRQRLLRIDASLNTKTRVVPLGVASELRDVAPIPLEGLEQQAFALVVGDLAPRKNVRMLLDIWHDVHERTGMVLVVVGPEGWRSRSTRDRLEELARAGIARWYGRVPDSQLRWSYEHARVVLYPSIEEGYGLPLVEAFEFGAPIIASDDAALVEVARGRALHLDAQDAAAWRTAVIDAASTGVERTPAAGDRGDEVSWSKTVEGTVRAYRDALSGGSQP